MKFREIEDWIRNCIKSAYREGFEAGYLASINRNSKNMTFTYFRDDVADQEFHNSKAIQRTK